MATQKYGSYNKDENYHWKLNSNGIKYSIDKANYSNWFYDRVANGVSFDEVNTYLATVLNYETIQMPIDTNTSISWAFELTDIRLPEDGLQTIYKNAGKSFPQNATNWRKEIVTKRRYPYIIYDTTAKPISIS